MSPSPSTPSSPVPISSVSPSSAVASPSPSASATASPSQPPTARVDAASAWDSTKGELVIFGGFDQNNNFLSDTWTWSGSWTSHSVAGPTGRRYAGMAFDPGLNKAVLFGGQGPCQGNTCPQFFDTWTWDGTRWTNVPTLHQPQMQGVMAYDPASRSILMWGFGLPPNCCPSGWRPSDAELWKWTGSDWSEINVQGSGSAMLSLYGYKAVLSQDPAGRIILVGHTDGMTANTWEWDGSKWSLLGAVGPAFQFNLAADPATKSVVAEDASGTWNWDGQRWTMVSGTSGPGDRQEASMAYDDRDRWVLLFAGLVNNVAYGMRNDIWAWDGQSWKLVQ